MEKTKAALIVGAGDATGSAIARRFATEGFTACVARRNGEMLTPLVRRIEMEGGKAVPFSCDCRIEDKVVNLVKHIEQNIGTIEVAVHNIGANVNFPITETSARVFYKVWEMACFSGFLVGREVSKVMSARRRGTILFTGATASIRGGAGYSAFSGAKQGVRALSQSMARELGPQGIHVAHIVIDGAIDTKWTKEMFPNLYQLRDSDGILDPELIAENYWNLHCQPCTTWTHELDLRPWIEEW